MKEQFDKDLAKKIRDSFENYEAPYDSKAWEKLSKAYFKPKRSAWSILWPFITTGLAASLFLAIILWPDFEEDNSSTVSDALAPFSTPQEKEDSIRKMNEALDEIEGVTSGERNTTEQPEYSDAAMSQPHKPSPTETTPSSQATVAVLPDDEKPLDSAVADLSDELPSSLDIAISPHLSQGDEQAPLADYSEKTIPQVKENAKVMGQEDAMDFLENWKNLAEGNETQEKPKAPLPFKLGVLVAPQSNSNPVSGMNLGAGVMSEISLSKKIKLDVGVTYARQSMSPDNQYNMPQTMDMAMARTNSNFLNSSYQLDFASLDIPINLKYQVMESKNSGFYLITGLSSMVYLNQQATETFQTNSFFTTEADGLLSFTPSVQQFSTLITPDGGENNVDLGRMVNLSIGYEYNLSDGMFISFEPFYKLPIGSLTFANQQFSIGGLNLRMNFKMGK